MSESYAVIPRQIARTGTSAPDRGSICDAQFMDEVSQLRALRSYLIRQAKITDARIPDLERLSVLRYNKDGRFPTNDERSELERGNQLYRILGEPDRRRFLSGQIPSAVIWVVGVLGAMALCSLLAAFTVSVIGRTILASGSLPPSFERFHRITMFVAFLTWISALGGIGSIAFIGMNALAVLQDVTFDTTNKKLVILRSILGALFGVVITLPVGYKAFTDFISSLFNPSAPGAEVVSTTVLLLLPFVLGFSTTLVIMIMSQFVDAIQTFFGDRTRPDRGARHPPARPRSAPARRH